MQPWHGTPMTPRIGPRRLRVLVPTRRLLPLELSREADAVGTRERIGLIPGDVDYRTVRVERLDASEPGLGRVVGRSSRPAR